MTGGTRFHPLAAAALVVLAAALVLTARPFLFFAWTNSLGYRLFRVTERFYPSELTQGSFVQFPFSHPLVMGGKTVTAAKRIACDEGHRLSVSWPYYFCDGDYLGAAKQASKKGEPAPRFVYDGTVPAGKAFVMGTGRDSFDSRYWGFLDKRRVTVRLLPIF